MCSISVSERRGIPFQEAFVAAALNPKLGHTDNALAVRLLRRGGIDLLPNVLDRFFADEEENDIYTTALLIEELDDLRAVRPMVDALASDPNPNRRKAAARALGWMRTPRRRLAARALAQCLADPLQPQPAREESAESLAYVGGSASLPALIAALRDPDVRIRFWSVFGLGGSFRGHPGARAALERVLDDPETPPGNWWSVGREALAMLGRGPHALPEHRNRMTDQLHRIRSDSNASPEDRRWADFFDQPN